MNKSERYNTITELTVLSSNLRRRRDAWKQRANALSSELSTTRKDLETAKNALRKEQIYAQHLRELIDRFGTSSEAVATEATTRA